MPGLEIRTAVRGLGEIALRVENLDAMQTFYQEIIGLPLMNRTPHWAFFKIGAGYGGHTQVLALFDRLQVLAIGVAPSRLRRLTISHSRSTQRISLAKR